MKKLKIKGLDIEITRKCNRKCKHCAKGEAQDITISKEIIDKIFSDVQDCEEISLCGGEPLLEIDIIKYIIDKIIENKWSVRAIQLTTNATIRDPKICDIYKKYCQSGNNKYALLRISDDPFHDSKDVKMTMNFYSSIISRINKELGRKLIVLNTESQGNNIYALCYCGRAKNYIDTHKYQFVPFGKTNVICPNLNNHRIRITNDEVICKLMVSANGNIGIYGFRSFEQDDKLAFGNILNNDITSLIMKHNDTCLLRCEEVENITAFSDLGGFVPNLKDESRIYFKIVGIILKKFHLTRSIAKQKYENIPAQDIITNIPSPTTEKILPILQDVRNKYRSEINPFSSNADQFKDLKDLVTREDFYFYSDANEVYGFGSYDDLLNSPAFTKLKELNEKYKNGELIYNNDKVFKCDSDYE